MVAIEVYDNNRRKQMAGIIPLLINILPYKFTAHRYTFNFNIQLYVATLVLLFFLSLLMAVYNMWKAYHSAATEFFSFTVTINLDINLWSPLSLTLTCFPTNLERNYASLKMFNCSREFQALRDTLKDVPQWSVISGPVNSGKSTLYLKL